MIGFWWGCTLYVFPWEGVLIVSLYMLVMAPFGWIAFVELMGWLLTVFSNRRFHKEKMRRDEKLWARVSHGFQGYLVGGSLSETINKEAGRVDVGSKSTIARPGRFAGEEDVKE